MSFGKRVGAVALVALAALATWLEPERWVAAPDAIAGGEVWRLWTGHWVHASWNHFALDAGLCALFVLLTRAGWYLLIAPPLVTLGVFAWRPELTSYLGLSGLLHGLALLAVATIAREERGVRRYAALAIGGVTLAKVGVEAWLRTPLFPYGIPEAGTVVFEAHALGAFLALPFVVWPHIAIRELRASPTL